MSDRGWTVLFSMLLITACGDEGTGPDEESRTTITAQGGTVTSADPARPVMRAQMMLDLEDHQRNETAVGRRWQAHRHKLPVLELVAAEMWRDRDGQNVFCRQLHRVGRLRVHPLSMRT